MQHELSQLRAAVAQGPLTLDTIFERWRHFCEKPPKGFEKYFRQGSTATGNGGGKQSPAAAAKEAEPTEGSKSTASKSASSPPPSSASDGSSKSKSSSDWNLGMFGTSSSGKSGGTGGAGRPIGGSEGNEKEKWLIIGAMGVITLLGAAALFEMGYKEIAWKEFVNK